MRRIGFLALGMSLLGGVAAACSTATETPASSADAGSGDALAPEAATGANDGASTTDPADAGDDAAACKLPGTFGSEQCHQCLRAQCCDVITTCDEDTECSALLKCVLDCLPKPDAGGCMDGCLASHPDGQEKYVPVEECVVAEPPEGCAFDCS